MRTILVSVFVLALLADGVALAQGAAQTPRPQPPATTTRPAAAGASVPVDPGFVIGPEDVLSVLFWRDQEMSAEVTVRHDGMITLPLIRDVKAAGLTPAQLADRIQEAVREFITDASVTVVVRQLNSRKVFITGEVSKPGAYPLKERTTVLQLIALAGGLTEFAAQKDIMVMRADSGGTIRPAGQPVTFRFNYKEVVGRRNLQQNIELKPGDTVVVPEK